MAKTKDPNEIRISGKDLGQLAMLDACPRCFWIKRKCKKLPWQIFPGIFSSIDAYTKKVVHASFDYYKKPPAWIPEFKDVFTYHKVPHWSKFKRTDPVTGITVSGVMDDLLEQTNGSLIIPDYKTAKYTKTQDELMPLYEAQLNNYAWVQESLSDKPVDALYLVYCEPVTDPPADNGPQIIWPINKHLVDGFDMAFKVQALFIRIETTLTERLLAKAKVIIDLPSPPAALDGCKDCQSLDNLTEQLGLCFKEV